jgi:hypothetical protein
MRAASPEPAHELALLLAGTAAARARHGDRILELRADVDFEALTTFLRAQGMLALIGERIEQLAAPAPPERFREPVRAHALAARRQGVHQQMLTVRLIAALDDAGIRVLPLKGPLLGERLYGDVGARVSADVDLLVARPDLACAVDVVTGLGYRRHAAHLADATLPTLHAGLVHAELPPVELHWRVHWYEERFSADMLARSAPGPDGCLLPQPVDELAELLLLYARDGFAGLRLLSDVAAWWDRYATEVGRDGIAEIAATYPATARALASATLVAERLVGLPASEVLPAAALAHASRRAVRFANWPLRGGEGQVSANVSLVDWLLAPTGQRRALVRRHLLLSRQELLARWPEAAGGVRRRARLRLLHVVRIVRRYAIAGWTVARRGAWATTPPSLGGFDVR